MKRQEPFNVLRNPNSWSNAPRAEAVAFQILAATGITATQTAIAVATTVASLAISVATSAIISALTPAPPTPKQSLLVNSRDAAAPQEIVYGEVRKGGPITYLETTRGGSVLYQVIALAAHEIESVEAIYINDEVAVLSDDSYSTDKRSGAGWVTSPRKWSEDDDSRKHEIRIFYHLGDQTSITDTFANSSVESLDTRFFKGDDAGTKNFGGVDQPTKASFVGNGIAYLFVQFSYASDVFRNGIPTITAKIRGKKVFNPITSTTAYSNNAALCVRDYLTSSYGLNDPEVDDTIFSAAANTCDENVTLADASTEKRYTINGVVRADQPYGDVLQELTTACAGTLFWGGGKWKLQVGEYNAPTKTFTLDDLRSDINLQTRVNLRDQFNRVQGIFTDASQRYIAADYPPIESATFLAQDNDVEQSLNLDLPFTTSAATAQRLAKMTLFRGREQMTFSAEFGLNAFDVEVGEIVALTIDRYGWTDKEFEVVGWQFGSDQEAGDLRITLTLRETSEAAFDWDAEEEDIISNDTDLSGTPEPVSNLTASAYGVVASDGTFVNGILVDWDSSPSANRYELEWTVNDSIDYSAYGGIVAEASAVTTREQFIYKGYIEILFRQPDQDGFDFYNTGGGSGLDEEAFRAQLLASPERNTVKFAGITVREPTTQYVIKPVLDGIIYNIRVRAFNTFDQKSEWRSVTFTTSVKDGTIPNAPTGLTATAGYGTIKLGWNAVTTNTDSSAANDIFLYNIYRGTSSNPTTLVDTTAGTGWSDVSLTDSTTYYYRIKAVDFSGNESAYSANASATTSAAVTDGADGDSIYTGKVYYQTLQDTPPSTPSATSFNASTGAFTGLTSGWLKTQLPLQTTKTAWDKQEWSSEYTAVVAPGDTTTTDITFTTPDGAVQITTDIESSNYVSGSAGWRIDADTGDAEFNDVTVRGDLTGNSTITTYNGSTGVTMTTGGGTQRTLSVYANNGATQSLYASNSGGVAAYFFANAGTIGSRDRTLWVENSGGSGTKAIYARTASGGIAEIALSGVSGGGDGYAFNAASGSPNGYFASAGTYDPFTGAHISMINKTVTPEVGDILVDVRILAKTITDGHSEVTLSSVPNEKAAIGVCQNMLTGWITPPAFVDKDATIAAIALDPEAEPVLTADPTIYHEDYNLIRVNAVGEGAINVIGESGNISKGDLIVTSSTPGKGMKQSDDIVRSYTVAKAREDVTFSSSTEVKMVACIYLCG
jgi:hypothetical protein